MPPQFLELAEVCSVLTASNYYFLKLIIIVIIISILVTAYDDAGIGVAKVWAMSRVRGVLRNYAL